MHTYYREGNGNPLQYSCLENPMDGGAWWAAVHGVAESWTRLSNFTFTFHFPALEKKTATHSGVLAWRIPGTAEPSGLRSMGVAQSQTQLKQLSSSSSTLIKYFCFLKENICPSCLGEGNSNPLQYSCLENLLDKGAWRATVRGVAKSWIWLSDWTHVWHSYSRCLVCNL